MEDFFMKLTLEEKLRLVKLHIFDGVPIREIHEYCALYRKWGDEPFAKPAKRKYTREIKLEAIHDI